MGPHEAKSKIWSLSNRTILTPKAAGMVITVVITFVSEESFLSLALVPGKSYKSDTVTRFALGG